MFVRDLISSAIRRWYLMLVCLALTVIAGYGAFSVVPPTYQATASVVLLPPDAVVAKGDNPYLYLGGLSEVLGVLQVTINSPQVATTLQKPYPRTQYLVSQDLGTTGPIMQIVTTGPDEKNVLHLLRAVMAEMPATLAKLQTRLDVSTHDQITAMVLAQDSRGTPSYKTPIRALVVVVGGSLAGSVLIIGWLDRLLLVRKTKRAEALESRAPADTLSISAQPVPAPEWQGEDVANEDSPQSTLQDGRHVAIMSRSVQSGTR